MIERIDLVGNVNTIAIDVLINVNIVLNKFYNVGCVFFDFTLSGVKQSKIEKCFGQFNYVIRSRLLAFYGKLLTFLIQYKGRFIDYWPTFA